MSTKKYIEYQLHRKLVEYNVCVYVGWILTF